MNKDDILKMLRAGKTTDDICADFVLAVNEAESAYKKEQEDEARNAARALAADKAADALNEYFKLRYPDEEYMPITGDILDIIAETIMYGEGNGDSTAKSTIVPPAATTGTLIKPHSPVSDKELKDGIDSLVDLFLKALE